MQKMLKDKSEHNIIKIFSFLYCRQDYASTTAYSPARPWKTAGTRKTQHERHYHHHPHIYMYIDRSADSRYKQKNNRGNER